jgi:hypothetical protein
LPRFSKGEDSSMEEFPQRSQVDSADSFGSGTPVCWGEGESSLGIPKMGWDTAIHTGVMPGTIPGSWSHHWPWS